MPRRNEFEYAVDVLKKNYANAQRLSFVKSPIAWALYQTWKYFDRRISRGEKMDCLKTDNCYNDDDFVQRDDRLEELTVTITLCEYRNLLKDSERLSKDLDTVIERCKELEKELTSARQALAACELPKWIKELGDRLAHWGESPEEDLRDEETEGGDEENE